MQKCRFSTQIRSEWLVDQKKAAFGQEFPGTPSPKTKKLHYCSKYDGSFHVYEVVGKAVTLRAIPKVDYLL
ncbi:hypothetical protein SAMN04488542_107108 [Fontibacillus panacisegetis]|uniref:Uncharacterized protein n=1 Tax=Fontibacillus panacisegetis TaxID=670482 RepID=A0A1G7JCP6_9BACL|nr:hypothetical protein SAMN04488542_107108 [Fontibacillus panacisegetis]